MQVKFFGDIKYEDIDIEVLNLPQMLSAIRYIYGQELYDKLLLNKHHYLLQKSNDLESIIPLVPEMLTSEIKGYDTIIIVPEVSGETGIETGIAIAAFLGATGTAATVLGTLIAIAINVAISVALSFIGQLLSPTLSFEADPSQAQTKLDSALFNGAPNIREQGGSVPLVFGTAHCGGVLISAGISSEERTI